MFEYASRNNRYTSDYATEKIALSYCPNSRSQSRRNMHQENSRKWSTERNISMPLNVKTTIVKLVGTYSQTRYGIKRKSKGLSYRQNYYCWSRQNIHLNTIKKNQAKTNKSFLSSKLTLVVVQVIAEKQKRMRQYLSYYQIVGSLAWKNRLSREN